MKYILDTNIIIYYLKGEYDSIRRHLFHIPSDSILIPSIVLAELYFGADNSSDTERNKRAIDVFISAFEVIDFDKAAAAYYGRIRSELKRAGTPIGANDMLIAALALAHNAVLVTHNVREFSFVSGLITEDWV